MTDTDLNGWTDDGHTATLTLTLDAAYSLIEAHVHCPFTSIDVTGIAIGDDRWRALPGCRRELDEFHTPIGPSKECLIDQWSHELALDELFDEDLSKSYVIVSPFRVAWRWLSVEDGPALRPVGLAVYEEPSR